MIDDDYTGRRTGWAHPEPHENAIGLDRMADQSDPWILVLGASIDQVTFSSGGLGRGHGRVLKLKRSQPQI